MTPESWLALCAVVTMFISLSNLIVSLRLERLEHRLHSAMRALKDAMLSEATASENMEKARRAFWAVVSREGGRANRKHKGGTDNESE